MILSIRHALAWRLLSFEDLGDHVRAVIEDIQSGQMERVIADYLVGYDQGRGWFTDNLALLMVVGHYG